MALFSVIIPVYNVAPYLRECLDSVLAQTFRDWECLCVDDGSTDGSGAILDEYAAKDKRFRVFHQPNAGEGAARNSGLDSACGTWVVFLDGDDVFSSNALLQISLATEPGINLICYKFHYFKEEEKVCFPPEEGDCVDVDIRHDINMEMFYVFALQIAYRRSMLSGLRFPHYKRGADRIFVDTLLLRDDMLNIRKLPHALYGYRQRPGSAMNSEPSPRVLRDEMDHRLDIMEMIDASGKKVDYAGNWWLEGYFTRRMSGIVRTRGADRREVLSDWRKNLVCLRHCKGLSKYGRFVAWSCPLIRLRIWDTLVCSVIPVLREHAFPLKWIKRKLTGHR